MKVFTYVDNPTNRRLGRVGQQYHRSLLFDNIVQLGGSSYPSTPVPEKIQQMIKIILPQLTESTQNVIHFLNLRVNGATGRGAKSTAYEALANRWNQYASFTQNQTNKQMARQIGDWYNARAKELD